MSTESTKKSSPICDKIDSLNRMCIFLLSNCNEMRPSVQKLSPSLIKKIKFSLLQLLYYYTAMPYYYLMLCKTYHILSVILTSLHTKIILPSRLKTRNFQYYVQTEMNTLLLKHCLYIRLAPAVISYNISVFICYIIGLAPI